MRVRVLAVLLMLAVLSGCGETKKDFPLPPDGVSRFPTGEALEVGDVILARSYGLIGAMFANHSEEGGEYSHGAMVYKSESGRLMMLNYRPTGMETCTPEEFFTRYNRLALIRYNGSFESVGGAETLSALSLLWLRKNAETRIPPDYHLDHDEHSAMFCLELTSTVYRDAGLPDPFNRAKKAAEDPLLKAANSMFKADVYEIRSPSSALTNPDFRVVSQWSRPDYDLREEALNEELMRVAVEDIRGGLWPKKPRLGGRMKLRQIFAIYHVVTKAMFWKPKQDLPGFIDQEVIGNGYMLYSYIAGAKKAAKKRMARETCPVRIADGGGWDAPDLERVRGIVREESDRLRGRFMEYR
jgi:hypothetical protein